MTVGFVILAHERLDRVAQVARHLQGQGAPVVVHVDRRVRRQGLDGIDVIQTQASDWGRFSLVQASLDAAEHLIAKHEITHVALISGACLPVRPVAELQDHVAAHPDRDFIESVDIAQDTWVHDGLSGERFTMWHPFSHRHQPRLFSAAVEVQRALRIRRRMPAGVRPHLGSQWWVLSVQTLRAILTHGRLLAWKRFFRSTWIPDESFFQTVVRMVADAEPLPSLHFSRFDPRGKPYVFHDGHGPLLRQSGAFLARKIDPDAGGLYEAFLSGDIHEMPLDGDPIEDARQREVTEGKGVLSAGRFPNGTTQVAVETAEPYLVFVADDEGLLTSLQQALSDIAGVTLHGQLFAASKVEFADGADLMAGNLPASALIRDYRPAQYVQRVVWAEQGQRTAFFYRPTDPAPEAGQIIGDGNARLVLLGEQDRLTGMLCRPMPTKRRLRFRKPRLHSVWAWRRVKDPAYVATSAGIEDLRQLLQSDWHDPQGWIVPQGTRVLP